MHQVNNWEWKIGGINKKWEWGRGDESPKFAIILIHGKKKYVPAACKHYIFVSVAFMWFYYCDIKHSLFPSTPSTG
jgi:hypothetical protein